MQIMPVTSAWNEDISGRPLLANSAAMIAQIKSDLLASRQTLRAFYEMNYVLVPDDQPRVTIPFFNYPDESDLDGGTFPNGRYPIPPNLPVEGWPRATGDLSSATMAAGREQHGGDRHSIIVAPGTGSIWETWLARLTTSGWEASNGAKFDLNSNTLRPAGWTSGDAAGLPMFPALVRYDECERGMVEHALRLVVAATRREYIYPANHYASSIPASSVDYPAMGQRLRLKSSFLIPDTWTIEEKAVLRALKKYGAIVADNGNFFSVSVCPDDRFSDNAFDHLSTIDDNFEVIQTTGPEEGPRSPGTPTVEAGSDQVVDLDAAVILHGIVNAPAGSATVQWKLYPGLTSGIFGSTDSAHTSGQFRSAGRLRVRVERIRWRARGRLRCSCHFGHAARPDGQHFHPSRSGVSGERLDRRLYRARNRPERSPHSSDWTFPCGRTGSARSARGIGPELARPGASGNVVLLNDKLEGVAGTSHYRCRPRSGQRSRVGHPNDAQSRQLHRRRRRQERNHGRGAGVGLTEMTRGAAIRRPAPGHQHARIGRNGGGGHDRRVDRYRRDPVDHSLPRDWSLSRRSRHYESVTRPNARPSTQRAHDSQRTTIGRTLEEIAMRPRRLAPPNNPKLRS